jgi:hypothetical protein
VLSVQQGYMFQGGVAEWIQRARRRGWHRSWPDLAGLLLLDQGGGADPHTCANADVNAAETPLPPSLWQQSRAAIGEALGGWVAEVDVMTAAVAAGDMERAMQRDMDTFFVLHGRLLEGRAEVRGRGGDRARAWVH